MRAYLWTPTDLVCLDLEPRLHTAARRLASLDARLTTSAARLGNTTRRARILVDLLTTLIGEARGLPAQDARAAKTWIEQLERRATRLRGRWPGWVYTRCAEHAAYRLLPHPIVPRPGQPIPSAIRERVELLRARGHLVLAPESGRPGGVARRPSVPRRARAGHAGDC